MKIIIAPDSFKESMTAQTAAEQIKAGFETVFPEADYYLLPIGDGGEGTVDAIVSGLEMTTAQASVTGPFFESKQVSYAYKDKLAIFEMADIVGLGDIPVEQRNPLAITTRGIGELIRHLVQEGFEEILLAVGGSASNDGGIGMAQGLGYRFYDNDHLLEEVTGQDLVKTLKIDEGDTQELLKNVTIKIITDVMNPLCGPNGATYVFAGQKGLPASEFASVDQAMEGFYQSYSPETINLAGAGAGGGMAAGLVAFAHAEILSGINFVLDLLDYDNLVRDADLVIVGEGKLDRQSLSGKAPIGVARRTPPTVPVLAFCGVLGKDLPDLPFENIQAAFPILTHLAPLPDVLAAGPENIKRLSQQVAQLLNMDLTKPRQ